MTETDREVAAARLLLDHHRRAVATSGDIASSESDIRAAVANLLVATGVACRETIALEAARTDLRTGQIIVEVKRRILNSVGDPDRQHIGQLDRYLDHARVAGRPERLGVLTDGRNWALRASGDTGTAFPPAAGVRFTLRTPHDVGDWRQWLTRRLDIHRSAAVAPTRQLVGHSFGSGIPAANDIAELRRLYDAWAADPTVSIKRGLWEDLLGSALGEVVTQSADLDGLFVRHTYLATVVALALQASFGLNVEALAELDPARLIDGSAFAEQVGVRGVIESDFFGWPAEVEGGGGWVRALAVRVAAYDWTQADYDIGSVLYQSVVTAGERQRLGEYYTPDWLARQVVEATVDDPLNQRVLDPSCGSGTFLREAIRIYIAAADRRQVAPAEALAALQRQVIGVDVHPVAVHLARASWVLSARTLIRDADGKVDVSVPVYLGDSLQLRSGVDTLMGQEHVTVHTDPSLAGGAHVMLEFPKGLVDSGDQFDALLMRAATDIEAGVDPAHTLQETGIAETDYDYEMLLSTLRVLKRLHDEGRNHIWAYYTRNLVRPVWLSTDTGRVDRIVGNPPWLAYNKTVSTIRDTLREEAKNRYRFWPSPRYVTHADLAGLFYACCVRLYLKAGGRAGMVMPHSTLAGGHYKKWRTGNWGVVSADLSEDPWNLETLQDNSFFPIPACVVFATKTSAGRSLSTTVTEWHGSPPNPTKKTVTMPGVSAPSPYKTRAYQGATIVPRRLFFVTAQPSPTALIDGLSDVQPQTSPQDKPPWKTLDVSHLGATIPDDYIHPVHLGATLAPFVTLTPHKAVLPFDRTSAAPPRIDPITGDVSIASLHPSVRRRWKHMTRLWDNNRKPTSTMSLIQRLDYMKKLSKQVPAHPIRLLYTTSGRPTAAVLEDSDALADHKLYWIKCRDADEAHYLAAVINSDTLHEAAQPLMSKGQYGARDLHKHLWKLAIPEYDPSEPDHTSLARLGRRAATEMREALAHLHATPDRSVTWRIARRELRSRLAASPTGQQIEHHVAQLGL